MKQITITIGQDSTARTVGENILTESLGMTEKRRASHIEPVNTFLRIAFYAVRWWAADNSPEHEWTRNWKCLWRVNIVDGPTWGSYSDRLEAIADEVKYLETTK